MGLANAGVRWQEPVSREWQAAIIATGGGVYTTLKSETAPLWRMSIELPFAPVDDIIRRNADGLRVSAGAAEELARRIQEEGARRAISAAQRADTEGRKTLMVGDFVADDPPSKSSLALPIAPIDRIARLDIDDRYRVAMDARLALTAQLESYADDVAAAGALLARHADRRTVKAEDIEAYFELEPYFE